MAPPDFKMGSRPNRWGTILSCILDGKMAKMVQRKTKIATNRLTRILPITAALMISWAGIVHADRLMAEDYQRVNPHFTSEYRPPAPQQSGSVGDMLTNIFLEQGILGAMLLILGGYFYKMESLARQDRLKLQEKFETLVTRSQDNLIEVKTHLSSMDARMQNLERESEALKDFIFTKLKT